MTFHLQVRRGAELDLAEAKVIENGSFNNEGSVCFFFIKPSNPYLSVEKSIVDV